MIDVEAEVNSHILHSACRRAFHCLRRTVALDFAVRVRCHRDDSCALYTVNLLLKVLKCKFSKESCCVVPIK